MSDGAAVEDSQPAHGRLGLRRTTRTGLAIRAVGENEDYVQLAEIDVAAMQRSVSLPNPVSQLLVALLLAAILSSGTQPVFMAKEAITRFIRDRLMLLALTSPIRAGMGLYFAVVVGAVCVQAGSDRHRRLPSSAGRLAWP